MSLTATLAASAVGSFPHYDPNEVCELILEHFSEIPVWPQLPNTNLREQMEIQCSEGMPRVVIDEDKRRMYFDTSGDTTSEFEKFYENYLAENLDYFAITREFSRGILAMEEMLKSETPSDMKYFKMQVTGPVSFALTIVDENKRAIYYNELFRDVVVKAIAMKARWQLRKFKPISDKRICIIDEPILSAFGSSTYVSVHRNEVVSQIKEVVEGIHNEGGLAGIHCCGNTEWTIPLDAGVDIINFDAFQYGTSIMLYPEAMKKFINGGGLISWGLVPTSEMANVTTTRSHVRRFDSLVDELASKGIDRDLIVKNSLVTASCGTGSVPVGRSTRVATETRNVSDQLKDKYHHLLS